MDLVPVFQGDDLVFSLPPMTHVPAGQSDVIVGVIEPADLSHAFKPQRSVQVIVGMDARQAIQSDVLHNAWSLVSWRDPELVLARSMERQSRTERLIHDQIAARRLRASDSDIALWMNSWSQLYVTAGVLSRRALDLEGAPLTKEALRIQDELQEWLASANTSEDVELTAVLFSSQMGAAPGAYHWLRCLRAQVFLLDSLISTRERDQLRAWLVWTRVRDADFAASIEPETPWPARVVNAVVPRQPAERALPRETRAGPHRVTSTASEEDDPTRSSPVVVELP